MTRRERIRARLIYRAWSINQHVRWYPPYGWITKTEIQARVYSMGAMKLREVMETMLPWRWRESDVVLPIDPTRYKK